MPTTCGSPRILGGNVPTRTATAVERLEQAGAVLLGKLHMTEFAFIAHHPDTRPAQNPWALDRSPGGSSSGSAVAAACGLASATLGTDTAASIRLPAAWCGAVGLKPTWGRVSRDGVFPLAASLDHVGPIARSVADAALAAPLYRRSRSPRPLDAATRRAACGAGAARRFQGCANRVGRRLRDDGRPARRRRGRARGARPHGGARCDDRPGRAAGSGDHGDDLHRRVRRRDAGRACRALPGARCRTTARSRATRSPTSRLATRSSTSRGAIEARAFRQRIDQLFDEIDVLLCPVSSITAPPQVDDETIIAIFANDHRNIIRLTRLTSLSGTWPRRPPSRCRGASTAMGCRSPSSS